MDELKATLLMIRDAAFSKKFIGVIAASYFLYNKCISGSEWVTVMMVYLGANVLEKGVDAVKGKVSGGGE